MGKKEFTRRQFIGGGVAAVGLATVGGISGLAIPRKSYAAKKINMRMSVSTQKGWHATEATIQFASYVRKKTNNEVDIKVYTDGALGGVDAPGTEGCINGQWELAVCAATNFSNFTNVFRATELPYLFLTKEDTYKVADGEPGQIMEKALEKIGLKLLQIYDYGFRNYYNNVREVRSPEDMKGQKVRTSYSPMEIAIIKAQGGNPTPISWAEVITSLAQGVVDGCGNADDLIYSSKQFEVLKYCTETKYMYTYWMAFMNLKTFQTLPKDIQGVIMEASREAVQWQRKKATEDIAKSWEMMTKKGIKKYVPNSNEMKAFMKSTKPVWDEYVNPKQADPELVGKILNILGRTKEDIFS